MEYGNEIVKLELELDAPRVKREGIFGWLKAPWNVSNIRGRVLYKNGAVRLLDTFEFKTRHNVFYETYYNDLKWALLKHYPTYFYVNVAGNIYIRGHVPLVGIYFSQREYAGHEMINLIKSLYNDYTYSGWARDESVLDSVWFTNDQPPIQEHIERDWLGEREQE